MAGQGIAAIRNIRDFTAIFDRDRFGLNVQVGVTYFIAQLVTSFTWMIIPLIRGYGIGWSPWGYYETLVVLSGLEAAAFVLVVHRARGVESLLLGWGAVSILVSMAFRGVIRLADFEGWSAPPLFDPLMLGSSFVSGVLFMFGLVVGVRWWGVVPEAFWGGAAVGAAVHAVAFQVVWVVTQRDAAFSWASPISAAVSGAIVGGLVYVGVARHMKSDAVAGRLVAQTPPGAPAAPTVGAGAGAGAAQPASAYAAPPIVARPAPVVPATTSSPPGTRQHWFVCCPNPSLIQAFMEVYGVARAAGWGEYRRLHASVFGGEFEAMIRAAKAAYVPFPGKEFMGAQSWDTTSLESVLTQIQAGATQEIHVAYGVTTAARADWMKSTYETLIGEALKQGILPFRMYMTESEAAAAVLLAAFAEG